MITIFPQPQIQKNFSKSYDLSDRSWIVLPQGVSPALFKRIAELQQTIEAQLERSLQLTLSSKFRDVALISVIIDQEHFDKCEAFKLVVSAAGIVVTAADEAGALYGFNAAVQLLAAGDSAVKRVEISDYPDFAQRGVMLDVSRDKVPTMATLKLLIDRLALMRINHIQLYIEHTFAFSEHKMVWKDASPLTHAEIKELDIYCTEHFIQLVPNLNSFGHLERWLKYPEYQHLAECPQGFTDSWGTFRAVGAVLKPNRASIDFIAELYDEYLPQFSGDILNVGCDETLELGQGWSKKLAAKKGITRVYLDHLKKINCEVAKRGKRMMFWGDIILHQPELIPELPADCIAMDWGYEANSPFAKTTALFADAGLDFYVCPGTSSWLSITGRTANCLKNIENAAKNGLKNGAAGLLMTDWGDKGHHQTLPVSYLGYAVGAAYGWSLKRNRKNDWSTVLDRCFFGGDDAKIGQLWLELGATMDYAPKSKLSNSTFIYHLLNSPDTASIITQNNLTNPVLEKCFEHLNRIEVASKKVQSTGTDGALVIAELEHSILMTGMALQRGLLFGAKGDFRSWKNKLQVVIASHEKQWLRRNRIGGLTDSSQKIKDIAEQFQR
jgi:hexosaminidase